MSFNESENLENRTTQPELTELYQQNQKSQTKTEPTKQTKTSLAKSSTSEQMEDAIAVTQQKAVQSGKTASKAAIVAGKKRGLEQFNQFKKGKDLAFLNAMAEDELKFASQLLGGIEDFNSTIDNASSEDVSSLLDLDEDEEIELLKKELEQALGNSKKSQTTNNLFFNG